MVTKIQAPKKISEEKYKKEVKEMVAKKKEEIKAISKTPDSVKIKGAIIRIFMVSVFSLLIGIANYYINKSILYSAIIFLAMAIALNFYFIYREKYKAIQRIRKIEEVFPDFIELMASNLRAGMTIDKSLLVSSRKEFAPLDEEILLLGKDIVTGKEITVALRDMGERIKSEKIKKTLSLIITGIVSGGNLSVLLEETAANMRERSFVEKRASSNVLMYIIFVFFAVAVGAPILFGLSSVLVKTITEIVSNVPKIDAAQSLKVPFTLTKISVSVNFVNYFSLIYLIITSILSSLVIGVVNKGEEKSGINYMLPLAVISTTVFFLIQIVILRFVLTIFS